MTSSKTDATTAALNARARVLIVEDEFLISMAFRAQLRTLGCEVVGIAKNTDAAIEMAHELRPDIILMDLGLPGKNGVEATRSIMAEAEVSTRIIVVTAYEDERVEQAKQAGAVMALTKPIVEEQLARAIETAVATPLLPSRPTELGDL